MDFAKKLAELRKQRNMTQEDLGRVVGISTAAISKWENENAIPDIYMLIELADYFNISTDELLGRNLRKKKVAIADDAKFMRDNLERILQDNDYNVIVKAENGKALLEDRSFPKAEILLLDLDMPVMNGFDALEVIRRQYPSIKVVICSVDGSEKSRRKARELGAVGYVTKPFMDEEILFLLNNLEGNVEKGNTV